MRSPAIQDLLDKINPDGKEEYTHAELMPPMMKEWGGYERNCSCHIAPPCQECVNWSNCCDERMDIVEAKIEPGCTIISHGCYADGVA